MIIRLLIICTAWILAAFGLGACSKSDPIAKASANFTATQECDPRMLKLNELAGILMAPLVDRSRSAGDGQTCQFLTAGFSAVTVSVRPNVGHATVEAWGAGRMPFQAIVLPGVGDEAVWQETLHEVIAQKNNLLCDIEVRGSDSDIASSLEGLPMTLGALCTKIFLSFG